MFYWSPEQAALAPQLPVLLSRPGGISRNCSDMDRCELIEKEYIFTYNKLDMFFL
jgi:hypothetical protein